MKKKSTLDINPEFKKAFVLIEKSNKNVFITGKAGTGKSTLLSHFQKTTKKECVVLAPTGVAALNVGGQTIHSFFRFKPGMTLSEIEKSAKKLDITLLKAIDVFIIDEISMVRADMLDCIDQALKIALKIEKPFGGKQMIFIGDLYQLPPVVQGEDKVFFQTTYKSPYFFDAQVFAHPDFSMEYIELEKVYRQQDESFVSILNAIRNKTMTDEQLMLINHRVEENYGTRDAGYIYLTTTNKTANTINKEKLEELPGKTQTFSAFIKGDFDRSSYPTEELLELKIGARVMFLNNDATGDWVNGTIGTILNFEIDDEEEDMIIVQKDDGEHVSVTPYTWNIYRSHFDKEQAHLSQESLGSFKQYPLRLSWAITIHKAQGKTFDSVIIDFERGTFAHGQAYVALSRCRTLSGMMLTKPLQRHYVLMDFQVSRFLTRFQYQQSEQNNSLASKTTLIEQAIEQKKRIHVIYLKSDNSKSQREITPYLLGEMSYKGVTYVGINGFCHLQKKDQVFRVDRMLEINIVNE